MAHPNLGTFQVVWRGYRHVTCGQAPSLVSPIDLQRQVKVASQWFLKLRSIESPTMAITPTQFAKKTAQCENASHSSDATSTDPLPTAASWADAKRRVLSSYREWIRGVRPR